MVIPVRRKPSGESTELYVPLTCKEKETQNVPSVSITTRSGPGNAIGHERQPVLNGARTRAVASGMIPRKQGIQPECAAFVRSDSM
jgi:hypothetical protein